MKRHLLIFLTLGLCMLAGACSSKVDDELIDLVDGDMVYMYALTFSFEDETGNNPVTGINTQSESNFVSPLDYSIALVGTDSGLTSRKDQLRLLGSEGKEQVIWLITPMKAANDITLIFRCGHIFGDNEAHTIVTHWINQKERKMECDRLTFDGVEQTLFTPDPANTFIKGVKITVSPGK